MVSVISNISPVSRIFCKMARNIHFGDKICPMEAIYLHFLSHDLVNLCPGDISYKLVALNILLGVLVLSKW